MSDRTAAIVETVMNAPLHEFLGFQLIDAADPARGIELTVDDRHLNNVGILHGGIFPSCLDVAAYLAVLPALAEGTNATTVSASTAIARGARSGDVVEFVGEVTQTGRTLAFVTSRAVRDGRTIATCDLVKAVVPAPDLG